MKQVNEITTDKTQSGHVFTLEITSASTNTNDSAVYWASIRVKGKFSSALAIWHGKDVEPLFPDTFNIQNLGVNYGRFGTLTEAMSATRIILIKRLNYFINKEQQ